MSVVINTMQGRNIDEDESSILDRNDNTIHSGHFMVSRVHSVQDEEDEDDNDVSSPKEDDDQNGYDFSAAQQDTSQSYLFGHRSTKYMAVEQNLTTLFKCLTIAYSAKLTSPKWKRFKGLKMQLKDKIRLNNIIWREWYMQYIQQKNPVICNFAAPLTEEDPHTKPEAVVLEGKYWKRKLENVTAEYKKWRTYSTQLKNKVAHNVNSETLSPKSRNSSGDNDFPFFDVGLSGIWNQPVTYDSFSLLQDVDELMDFSDTLFSSYDKQFPFTFPNPKEISSASLPAEAIQPGLIQLQPNFGEKMEIDDLITSTQSHNINLNPVIMQNSIKHQETKVSQNQGSILNSILSNSNGNNRQQTKTVPHLLLTNEQLFNLITQSSSSSSVVQLVTNVSQAKIANNSFSDNQLKTVPCHSLSTTTAPTVQQLLDRKLQKNLTQGFSSSDVIDQREFNNEVRRYSTGSKTMPTTVSLLKNQFRVPANPPPVPPNHTTNNNNNKKRVVIIEPQKPEKSSNRNILAELLAGGGAKYKTDNLIKKEKTFVPIKPAASVTDFHKNLLIQAVDNACRTTEANYTRNETVTSTSVQNVVKFDKPKIVNDNCINLFNSVNNNVAQQRPERFDIVNVADDDKQRKRIGHVTAEQKRRVNIKSGFDTLHDLVPSLHPATCNSSKVSKATTLTKSADYIRKMKTEKQRFTIEMESLRTQIEELNNDIANCQAQLPATGVPVTRQRADHMKYMLDDYVKQRTLKNWKFWIFSIIIKPLFDSFRDMVSTASETDLCRTVLTWIEQHCSLVQLRPGVLNSLRELSTKTTILTDPSSVPEQATKAVSS